MTDHDLAQLETAIIVLRDQLVSTMKTLEQAVLLIDQLMTEMRLANVTPSAGIIFTKASFDQKMRLLLAKDRP